MKVPKKFSEHVGREQFGIFLLEDCGGQPLCDSRLLDYTSWEMFWFLLSNIKMRLQDFLLHHITTLCKVISVT